MSVTSAITTDSAPRVARRAGLFRTTVVVGLAAAVVTAAAAAAAHAAGVSFEIEGEMIPVAGFAQMAFVGAVVGGFMVALFNRFSAVPRRRFLQVAVVLTALSCVPSVAWPDDSATKAVLVVLHILAAAIVIPVLSRRAHD